MRVIVLGGTKFVGRAITERLAAAGHELMVVHRGRTEPADLPPVRHLHCDRTELLRHADEISAFEPDAAVDVQGMNGMDAAAALAVLPPKIPTVAISSVDVYRAYEGLNAGRQTDPLPLTEQSALRTTRFVAGPGYENLEVEEAYAARGATLLRLGMVYGPHDDQRRFEPILRRVRAGRAMIPIGTGAFLFSKVFVGDVARAVELALHSKQARGEAFNLVETKTSGFWLLTRAVLRTAGAGAVELVEVPDTVLPPDLALSGSMRQDLLADSTKARTMLGWEHTNPERAIAETVAWDLANPPEPDDDFTADDRALAEAAAARTTTDATADAGADATTDAGADRDV